MNRCLSSWVSVLRVVARAGTRPCHNRPLTLTPCLLHVLPLLPPCRARLLECSAPHGHMVTWSLLLRGLPSAFANLPLVCLGVTIPIYPYLLRACSARLPPDCTVHTRPVCPGHQVITSSHHHMARQLTTIKARVAAMGGDASIVYRWARDLAFDQEMHLPPPFEHVLLQDRYPFLKLKTLSDDELADAISCYRTYMYQYRHGFTERSTPRGAGDTDAATTTAGGCACVAHPNTQTHKHTNTQTHCV